ncbi:InlB B-repeat-containing protein [Salinibacterium sp. NSLL150]|uniref:InlB B-repeat-containing protein n=1 Tax=unclassified Salinibacterium TaxID=2632331 RepID=UPI0018CF54C3|nr:MULTISPECIES: InlB B-repeat-containing protein [unclassified Salinibacterium]MBH0099426.1 InlB B-repeat-containing protein [Salinibacterium sp. NSLL35]MBH0102180.1 InlB B-repeat-containing protein [Salinibacterium sp. NSLL150]MBH0104940.1 InlB B-repeat-containing protein [Salinibacterium sp. NSLL16]MBH0107700.1 InlB B-repeat-containing protein [Salinibacterium sp. NSLL17]MBH0110449.1 InlB B-repeat-containing protein [Salinibacterium sp. NG22]
MIPRPKILPSITAVALALALTFAGALPANAAATYLVNSWGGMPDAFAYASDGGTVKLIADIVAPAGRSITVKPGESITLDLNGHDLTVNNDVPDSLAAIEVPSTSTLTIVAPGGGTLTVTGGRYSAGIGGNEGNAGGSVIVNSGTITAQGGRFGAGIGGGDGGDGGTTTVNGGTITATGGYHGAGIGGGQEGDGGSVIVNSGTILATGGYHGAGIGGGLNGNGGTTTNSGTITATGGNRSAGIGGGLNGNGGTTSQSGGTISAIGGFAAAGIGGGQEGDGGTTTVSGGTLDATGGGSGAGIGGGYQGNGGTTILTGGTTTATGDNSGAGIGGGQNSFSSGVLDIHGIGAPGAATNGGDPNGALITNSTTPAGIGYTAATATVGSGGQISVEFVRIATFDAAGGTATDTAFVAIGDTLTEPTDPTRTGYTFAGWTVSGAAYDFTTPVTTPLTLTATWTEVPASYIISFDAANGTTTADASVSDGDTLSAPTDPTRTGYTFAGWTVSGAAYDFTTPVTTPLTLTATWTEVPATGGAPTADVTLAATGFALAPHLSVGATLLVAGFALLVLRRRVTARQR